MTTNDLILDACDALRSGDITYAEWLERLEAAKVEIMREGDDD